MASFLAELKRRNIYRVAAGYAVLAWLLLQIVNNVAPILDLPVWVARAFVLLLAVGFPVALFFAWMRELAPVDGATSRAATAKLDYVLAVGLVIVIALVSYEQLAPSRDTVTAQPREGVDAARDAAKSPATSISLAVLPFANLSGDANQEFFSDGITEEITSTLAKIPNLRVVGRTSAYQFKGQNRDLRDIGQLLSATHLIEGSVRREGNRLRITAQLIQADSGVHVWTENYDRELTSVFTTQEDIARAIAGALRVPLGLPPNGNLVRGGTLDAASYDDYLRAKALMRGRGFERLTEAVGLLEPVVAREPDYAPAWALLGQVNVLLAPADPRFRDGPDDARRRLFQSYFDKADRAAREAIRLDSGNALAYAALARVQERRARWAEAEDLHKQALALDPSEADAQNNYVLFLGATGRIKQAVSNAERLRELELFVPIYATRAASLMQQSGQIAAGIAILEALPPGGGGGLNRNAFLAMAYAEQGRYAEAADTLLLIDVNAAPRRIVEDAARLLRTAPATVKDQIALPALNAPYLFFVYAHIGAFDRVLEVHESGLTRGFNPGADTLWLPALAPLRKSERFKDYVRRAGLVDYWRERAWPDLCHPVGADDFACD